MALSSLTMNPRFNARHATALRPAAAPKAPVERELLLVATFCERRDEAQHLHRALSSHPRLRPDQVLLLAPADAESTRFAQCLRRWSALRPGRASRMSGHGTGPAWVGTAAGLVAGAAIALLTGTDAAEGASLALLAALLGMVSTLVIQAATYPAPRLPRFDRTVRSRLVRGFHAVVVQQPRGELTCVDLLEAMQRNGVAWCAEAPRRRR